MGEMSAAIIGGFVCRNCFSVIDETEPGFTRLCARCAGALGRGLKRRRRDGAHAGFEPDPPKPVDLIGEDVIEADA